MKKRSIIGVAVASTIALLSAVVPSQAAYKAASQADCGKPGIICVGLVTDLGHVNDKSFNQAAWQGTLAGAYAVGGHSKYIETNAPTDYAKDIDTFAAAKYNVIVTVGFDLAQATADAAVKYPNIKFIGVDQDTSGNKVQSPNYAGLVWHEDQAGFIAGYLAGYVTKSGKTATVNGLEIPPVIRYAVGFQNGVALAAKELGKTYPATKLIYHAAGNNAFSDPAFGATTADQLISQGYDVIFGVGGGTGNGAIEKAAQTPGVYCVGVDVDQFNTDKAAQKCLITSAEKLIAPGVTALIKSIKAGTFTGGLNYGKVGVAPFHNFKSVIPAAIQAKVNAVAAKIVSGKLSTGYKA
jgi:basic membrane protein A